jgi:hypothetical protein
MVRSLLVYTELSKTFEFWLTSIYGADNYLFYGNKARELHPPGLYILMNFY